MAYKFEDYVEANIKTEDGTPGGCTYVVNGKRVCFALTRSHIRAVQALTGGKSSKHLTVVDGFVDNLVAQRIIRVDEDCCFEGHGWLGAKVYDAEGDWIGNVGSRCSLVAGQATEHLHYGRCRLHGGAGLSERALSYNKSANTSKYLKQLVQTKVQAYMDDPTPLDLARELATLRALLDMMVDLTADKGDLEAFLDQMPQLTKAVDMVGKMVDRIVAIEQRYALTAGQVLFVRLTVTDALNRYITDPGVREEAALWIADRLGTKHLAEADVRIRARA